MGSDSVNNYVPKDEEMLAILIQALLVDPRMSRDDSEVVVRRWLAEHDERVRADQRERDAQIAETFTSERPIGLMRGIAAAIRAER